MIPDIQDDINSLRGIATDFAYIEDSCLYMHVEGTHREFEPNAPSQKLNGAAFLFLTRGNAVLQHNITKYELTGPAAIVFAPGSTIHFDNADFEDTEIFALYLSPKFLQDINVSFSAISGEILINRTSPALKIEPQDSAVFLRYFNLVAHTMKQNYSLTLAKHIISSLIAAFIYQLTAICYKQIGESVSDPEGSRRNNYVKEFLKLVHLYYMKERSVNYYASRLFISPKYLSMLVKEATGRSAARWIDHFVIIEAKNQLRFSGKNIQQVAYSLNFLNQSSFGKYFKHLTGMSPTEFQKNN